MINIVPTLKLCALSLLLTISAHAFAGRSCEQQAQKPHIVEVAVNSAVNLNQVLDNTGAKVVLVARVGQDLSAYGIKYSHVGFAYKKDGAWEVFHELNGCGSNQSALYVEGLANFFLDDMVSYSSKIFVPSLELQETLYSKLVNHPESAKAMHSSDYNMLAWPFSTKYQNSNQWVLEVLAGALSKDKVYNRKQAQQWLLNNNYNPTTVQIGTMKRLGARMFKANISFDDQPFDRRMQGYIDTISVDSVYEFLEKQDTKGKFIEIIK